MHLFYKTIEASFHSLYNRFNAMKLVFRFILAFLCGTGFLATSLSQAPQNPFTGKLGHPAIEGTLILDDYDVWGGSVIRHSDGRYYMFVSIWPAD